MKSAPAPSSHYENFPVASWLCPAHLRAPIAAIYWFARVADDIADEGNATAEVRLADLSDYRRDLAAAAQGLEPSDRWAGVFKPLSSAIRSHALPVPLLADLLDAFVQDVEKSRDVAGYATRAELLDYCSRSANPVGRLLLHLYGVTDSVSLTRSDAICSSLQLINFWQDLSVDVPRGRFYLPHEDRDRHGVPQADVLAQQDTPAMRQLIAELNDWARALMLEGQPLVHSVPGRAGWELRLVTQGGLRISERIAALQHATIRTRPKLGRSDVALMVWRSLFM